MDVAQRDSGGHGHLFDILLDSGSGPCERGDGADLRHHPAAVHEPDPVHDVFACGLPQDAAGDVAPVGVGVPGGAGGAAGGIDPGL